MPTDFLRLHLHGDKTLMENKAGKFLSVIKIILKLLYRFVHMYYRINSRKFKK